MADEGQKPPEQKPKTPHHIPETIIGVWNWAWGFFELQSVGDDVKDHAPLIRKRVSVLVLLFLVCLGGFSFKGCRDEDAVQTANSLTSSNAVVARIFESQLQAANQKIVADKIDADETKREKDAEIAKVTGERDSALLRVSQLESLPETAFLAYSNASAFNRMSSTATSYQLKINGLDLTNYILGQSFVIPLKKTREIFFEIGVLKKEEKSVEKLTIDFYYPLDPTNLVVDTNEGHWRILDGNLNVFGKTCHGIEMISQYTLTSVFGFSATSFNVSTNFHEAFFPARIDLFAPGTVGVQTVIVNFSFQ